MELAIADLLTKGARSPVINLRVLNRFLEKEPFKIEGLQRLRSLIQQWDFMIKLNLKDGYYALQIHPFHRKNLRFVYQNRIYEFQCLPFGLPSTPRAFKKTLKPVLAVLRSLGIRIVIFTETTCNCSINGEVCCRQYLLRWEISWKNWDSW